ncbi:transposase, partial [Tychonema sp. BBK16]
EALWSPSYFAVSVGSAPLEVLKEYIINQEKPS